MSDRPRYDPEALRNRAVAFRQDHPSVWSDASLNLEITATLEAFAEYVTATEARIADLESSLAMVQWAPEELANLMGEDKRRIADLEAALATCLAERRADDPDDCPICGGTGGDPPDDPCHRCKGRGWLAERQENGR